MKIRILCGLTAVAAAIALPAQAAGWFHHDTNRTSYDSGPPTPMVDGSAIHTAASNYDDQMLADKVADALRDDRGLNGATVTVAANDGRVALAGSAANTGDATRIQDIAKNVAGPGHVVAGSIDAQAGG
jgi:hypothetical protein